jgi:hypothetical protein
MPISVLRTDVIAPPVDQLRRHRKYGGLATALIGHVYGVGQRC